MRVQIKMGKVKDSLFITKDTGKQVVQTSWNATKMVVGVAVAGVALGAGMGALAAGGIGG